MKALTAVITLSTIALLASTSCGQSSNAGLLVGNVGPTGLLISLRGELFTQPGDTNCPAPR